MWVFPDGVQSHRKVGLAFPVGDRKKLFAYAKTSPVDGLIPHARCFHPARQIPRAPRCHPLILQLLTKHANTQAVDSDRVDAINTPKGLNFG
jgi:hypothetical protein